jgi:hypothetical protein
MTRLWLAGDPITVQATKEDGTLVDFRWREQDHAVEMVITRWRVDMLWWTFRVWRDYFELTTESGLLVVVYRDLIGDGWYLQRLYD